VLERKQAEEALRETEEKYRRVSDNSPAVLYQFMMTPDGAFSFPYVSDVVMAIMGITSEDIMKDPSKFLGMVHPEDQEMFREGIMKSAESLESFPITFRCMKDGEVIWIEARGIPTPLADGGMLWDGFLLDITERKQAEKALRESEEKSRTIIEHSNELFYIHDTEHTLTYVSQTSEDLLGYTPEEMVIKWTELATDNPVNQKGVEITES
jgi:PAS domain S-box-containing protein